MTILSVDFISKKLAEKLSVDDMTAVISISDSKVFQARLAPHKKILQLAFHDILQEIEGSWVLFDEKLGKQLITFVENLHNDSSAYQLLVHCRAGVSRSAAVALYVAAATNCDFPRRESTAQANTHVLKVLESLSGLRLERPAGPNIEGN